MRIIGGEWRSRRILLPEAAGLRPTPDRVRETLFNWLAPRLGGSVCLDLFAGSGALGFEALSRGAARTVFVERDPAAVAALERARRELGAEAGAEIIRADAGSFLARGGGGRFDLVFVDPPYAEPVDELLAALPPLLKPGGRIYLERRRGDAWPGTPTFSWLRRSAAAGVAYGLAELAR